MRQRAAKRRPIPLSDDEAVERCTIVRALYFVGDLVRSDSVFARASLNSWARTAHTSRLDLLALGWPEKVSCFVLAPRAPGGEIPALDRESILAAYRHALRDPHASKLLYPANGIVSEGLQ